VDEKGWIGWGSGRDGFVVLGCVDENG